jgi:hypothetical protein
MKISKRRLKRIIKEEKMLLQESMTDMIEVESAIEKAAQSVGNIFMDKMYQMFDEAPELLGDLAHDRNVWEDRVADAVLEVDTSVAHAMEKAVQEIEARLISGEF